MKNQTIFLITVILALGLVLAACSGSQGSNSGAGSGDPGSAANGSDTGIVAGTDNDPALITCTVQSQASPDLVRENDHVAGEKEDYALTIIVYNDFSCAGCQTIVKTLDKTVELYPDDVRLVYRHFPVIGSGNDNGIVAALHTEAAGKQGFFWEMHDFFFETQETWVDMDPDSFGAYVLEQVAALGMDPEQYNRDVNSDEITELIAEQLEEAMGYSSTPPVVLVNGAKTPIYLNTVEDFFIWLDTLMIPYGRHIRDRQFSECPPMTVDQDANYTATLHTEKGDIVLALYPDAAPITVNNFIFLAENDYYDNTPFYAVIEGYVAQAGDPSGTGWGTPGFLYGLEITPELSFEKPYMLAMVNSGPEASNSQFFITYSPLSQLNGQHTIFGEIIDGIDVLNSLTIRDPEKNPLALMGDLLLDVTIEKQ